MYTACAGALFSPTSLQKSVDLSINFQFTFRRLSTIFNHVLNKRVLVNVIIDSSIPRFHNRRTNKSANAFCQLQKLNLDCFTSD
ncbi:Wall-associated receptor kinase-like [Trichinella pseudospiralis]